VPHAEGEESSSSSSGSGSEDELELIDTQVKLGLMGIQAAHEILNSTCSPDAKFTAETFLLRIMRESKEMFGELNEANSESEGEGEGEGHHEHKPHHHTVHGHGHAHAPKSPGSGKKAPPPPHDDGSDDGHHHAPPPAPSRSGKH